MIRTPRPIKLINTQRVLSPTQISLADYVINPYRGCEFGCLYCYSLENKNLKKPWYNFLGVKINAPQVLEKELKYKKPKRVLLGSTTECFQYQELNYGISEKILTILNKAKIPYTILTKSHLIEKYLELISKNKENKIYFTLNFSCDKIIKTLEGRSPSLRQRLTAIKKIIAANISLRVHIGPYIPYLSTLEEILKIIPQGAREVNVELYHHRMGNFHKILKATDEAPQAKPFCGAESCTCFIIARDENTAAGLKEIYENQENYIEFAKKLKEKIKEFNRIYPFKFFYIVPDFTKFYTATIDYEKAIF